MSQNQASCPSCGAAVTSGAQFCRTCGKPIPAEGARPPGTPVPSGTPPVVSPAVPPPMPRPGAARIPARKGSPTLPLALGAGALLGVCLCVCVLAGLFASQASPAVAPPSFEGEIFDAKAYQSLEKSVAKIETACRAGDADTVVRLTHPAVRSTFQPIFQAHRTELKRVGDLLATRKLVDMTYTLAEYKVTENGKEYFVTFEAWGEEWYLSSL